jgi:hypothetical protein
MRTKCESLERINVRQMISVEKKESETLFRDTHVLREIGGFH